MDINTMGNDAFRDLFPELTDTPQGAGFSGGSDSPQDIFSPRQETPETVETVETVETPENTVEPVVPEGEDTKEEVKDADILDVPDDKNKDKEVTDLKSYFEERLKSGRFIRVDEEDAEGNKIAFIPKTDAELDEVLELQINHRVDERLNEIGENVFKDKSPAWQMVAKYAEMTDNPEDVLAFIQPMKTFNSVSEMNPEDLEDAERIVRTKLEQTGDDEELISQTIESLKTTDKLTSTALKYKPIILNQEKQYMSEMVSRKKAENDNYNNLVHTIRESAIKSIETPIFGKTKLKQEEMASVYDLIGEPSKETKGYLIYSEIDSLFEKGDFDTLKEVAMLLKHKDSYKGYMNNAARQENSTELQRKLRLAAEKSSTSGNDAGTQTSSISRGKYNGTGRFGR